MLEPSVDAASARTQLPPIGRRARSDDRRRKVTTLFLGMLATAVILLGIMAISCTSTGAALAPTVTPAAAGAEQSREISFSGPQGGELRSGDGQLLLTVPGGLSPRSIRYKVSPTDAKSFPSPAGYRVVGVAYSLTAEEEGKERVARFGKPVQLRFTVKASELPAGVEYKELVVAYHNGTEWTAVPTTVDPNGGTVIAEVDHFTPYATVAAKKVAVTPASGVNLAPTIQSIATKIPTPSVNVAAPTVANSADAAAALSAWGKTVLSLNLTPNPASGFSTSASGSIPAWLVEQLNLSSTLSSAATAAVNMSGTAYGGLLSNGGMLLALGSGTGTGEITVNVQSASFGYTNLRASSDYPKDADAALALIKQTYPGIANRNFTPVSTQAGTYLFTAVGQRSVPAGLGKVTTVAEAVSVGVSRLANDIPMVYVAVGTGDFATVLK